MQRSSAISCIYLFGMLVTCGLMASSSAAETVEEFYRGKTVSIVVGAGEGGFYDLNGRLLARFLPKYLPGSPTVVPQNMPGASQLRATEHAYNLASRDGTSLVVVQPYVMLNRLLNDKLRFDIQKMTYIGRVGPIEMGGMVGRKSSIKTIADAKEKEIVFGANAANGPAAMIPWAVNRLVGTRFKVVLGYPSQTAEELAIERGEIEGIGNGSFGQPHQQDKLRILYISGPKRLASAPGAPTILELARPEDRPVMDLLASVAFVGLTVMAPPDIPVDRVDALRRAFNKVMEDSEYQAALQTLGFASDPLSGSELSDYVREHLSPSPDLVSRLRAVTAAP